MRTELDKTRFVELQRQRMRLAPWKAMADLPFEIEREDDGRWIVEVPQLPGVLAYGATKIEALIQAAILVLQVIDDRLEMGEPVP